MEPPKPLSTHAEQFKASACQMGVHAVLMSDCTVPVFVPPPYNVVMVPADATPEEFEQFLTSLEDKAFITKSGAA